MSSQSCEICGPKRISRALCNCCKQYLCLDHLREHDDLVNSQIEPLIDNINQILSRLNEINIEYLIQPIHFQLDQWKQMAFQTIEQIYQEKLNEINKFIQQSIEDLRKQTEQTQKILSQLIDKQNATNEQIQILTNKINKIQNETNYLENKSIDVEIHPIILQDNYIHFNTIKKDNDNENKDFILTPIIQTISSSINNSYCITINDDLILLHRYPTLCLYDYNLNKINETLPYTDLLIIDMCWLSILKHFLILTNNQIFILNPINMILDKSNIPIRTDGHWHNFTCSSKYLYITAYKWGSFIYQYDISLLKFQLKQKWQSPITCEKDESIDYLIHNNKNEIALIILNKINNNKYLQLRNDQTLEIVWSIQLNQFEINKERTKFCLINKNQFLILNSNQSKFAIYSSNGLFKQIIDYQYNKPLNAIQIKDNFIIIITNDSINLHQLFN